MWIFTFDFWILSIVRGEEDSVLQSNELAVSHFGGVSSDYRFYLRQRYLIY